MSNPTLNQTAAPAPRRLDLSTTFTAAEQISFVTLLRVEFRKLIDTTLGKVLLISGAALSLLLTLGAVGLVVFVESSSGRSGAPATPMGMPTFMSMTSGGLAMAAALLAIFTITGEWSHKTVLTTFALEPTRWRTLVAKLVIVVLLACGLTVLAFLGACGGLAIAQWSGGHVDWSLKAAPLAGNLAVNILSALGGAAMGLLFLNSAAAVTTYIVAPMVLSTASFFMRFSDRTKEWAPWIDSSRAQMALTEGNIHGIQWAHLALGVLIWVIIPLGIGTYRWMTKEAKSD